MEPDKPATDRPFWETYRELFISRTMHFGGPAPSERQLRDMRIAFYAGAYAAHHINEKAFNLLRDPDHDTGALQRVLNAIKFLVVELDAYDRELKRETEHGTAH